MTLSEVCLKAELSIVAFVSTIVETRNGSAPMLPKIFGTGFVVDERGIIATNRHVVEAFSEVPRNPRTGAPDIKIWIRFPARTVDDDWQAPSAFVPIKSYWPITEFSSSGPWCGEDVPDLAFVQVSLSGLPALSFVDDSYRPSPGLEIATGGFPNGEASLTLHEKIHHLMPVFRKGIVSAVSPFYGPEPHGLVLDLLQQGGSSGSPIFLADSPQVVGLLYSGYPGQNFTFAVASQTVAEALRQLLESGVVSFEGSQPVKEVIEDGNFDGGLNWSILGPRA